MVRTGRVEGWIPMRKSGRPRRSSRSSPRCAALAARQKVWKTTYPSLDLNAVNEMVINRSNVHGLYFTLFSVPLLDKTWLS